MVQVILSPLAARDIEDACQFTRARWGAQKESEYIDLIGAAYRDLEELPFIGQERPDILPGLRLYRIAKPGRAARHFFLYRVNGQGNVEIGRFLPDSVDFPQHVPEEW